MACSSSCTPLDFELQRAARAGLQSLHSFISLFSPASSLQQHQQSMAAATETIINFEHLGSLLSPRKGHARVRRAPTCTDTVSARSDSLRSTSPNLSSPIKPRSPPLGNPNFPSSHTHATGSYTSFEECDSVNFVDDGHSTRGSSHNIDLNHPNDQSDYYEGSINEFSRRGHYIEHIMAIDNCPSITNDYTNKHNNYGFSSIINDNNPSSFDLNQQAPSLDSSPSLTSSVHMPPNCLETKCNYNVLPSSPPFFCPQPIFTFPPPSQEKFSFDAHTQSAATLTPSASNTLSAPSSDDEFRLTGDKFTEFTNRSALYEGNSLTRQLAQIFSTNPNFEAHLEKAACLFPTPTQSCTGLEGNVTTNGSVPPVPQKPQPALAASMDQKAISSAVKRKYPSNSDDSKSTKCGNSPSKCHCTKRRKLKNKSIKRVPAISDKVAEIPHDDYSWRKYGQKPIKGSPYPRGYYKCSGVKGCPAKKHVERALDDPSMLIITYEGDHIHSKPSLEGDSKFEGSSLNTF